MASWFSSRLRRARLAQGISQGALAEKVGVSQATVSNWEKDKGKPDDTERKKLVQILGRFDTAKKASRSDTDDEISDGNPFGEWLRRAREAADLTVHELSEASGVSVPQIYNLETGRSTNPRPATRTRLEGALDTSVPDDVRTDVEEEQAIEGLGQLTDFDPHDDEDRPTCPGVYVFYDVSQRPIYVGKARSIEKRVKDHEEKFWFKRPIVDSAAYVEIKDQTLRHQVEQVLIKFLKSNAVINKQSVERDDG
jgi:transcriptional regulator with XRE-family HTH domain